MGETRTLITDTLSNRRGRISADQRLRRDVLKYDAACRNNGARPNLDARCDETGGSDPNAFTNSNRRDPKFEIFPSKIVAACAKMCALTDANIRFNQHRCEGEDAGVFANPDVVADCQSPRK